MRAAPSLDALAGQSPAQSPSAARGTRQVAMVALRGALSQAIVGQDRLLATQVIIGILRSWIVGPAAGAALGFAFASRPCIRGGGGLGASRDGHSVPPYHSGAWQASPPDAGQAARDGCWERRARDAADTRACRRFGRPPNVLIPDSRNLETTIPVIFRNKLKMNVMFLAHILLAPERAMRDRVRRQGALRLCDAIPSAECCAPRCGAHGPGSAGCAIISSPGILASGRRAAEDRARGPHKNACAAGNRFGASGVSLSEADPGVAARRIPWRFRLDLGRPCDELASYVWRASGTFVPGAWPRSWGACFIASTRRHGCGQRRVAAL